MSRLEELKNQTGAYHKYSNHAELLRVMYAETAEKFGLELPDPVSLFATASVPTQMTASEALKEAASSISKGEMKIPERLKEKPFVSHSEYQHALDCLLNYLQRIGKLDETGLEPPGDAGLLYFHHVLKNLGCEDV